jgi:hypothetical protein
LQWAAVQAFDRLLVRFVAPETYKIHPTKENTAASRFKTFLMPFSREYKESALKSSQTAVKIRNKE